MSSEVKFSNFAGINSQSPVSALTPQEQVSAVNADVNDNGYFVLREGYTPLVSNVPASSLYAHGNLLYYVEDGILVSYDPAIGKKLPCDSPLNKEVAYLSIADKLFYSDGLVARRATSPSSSAPWGIVPPRSAPTVTPAADGAERYLLSITFVRGDGEESGAPTPAAFKSAAGVVTVSDIPISDDPLVTSTAIYLTLPNGEALYRVTGLDAGVTSATLALPMASYGRELDSLHRTPPPASLVVGAWNGRALVGVSNFILYSDLFRFERFMTSRSYVPFESAPTAIVPISPELLIVGTEDAIYKFEGADIETAKQTKLADYGVFRGAWTYVDGSLMDKDGAVGRTAMLMSKTGICSITSEGVISNLTRKRYVMPQGVIAGAALAKYTEGSHQIIFSLRNQPRILL